MSGAAPSPHTPPEGPWKPWQSDEITYARFDVVHDGNNVAEGVSFEGPDAKENAQEHADTLNSAWQVGWEAGRADLLRERDELREALRDLIDEVDDAEHHGFDSEHEARVIAATNRARAVLRPRPETAQVEEGPRDGR